jgi:hypothetical protein
LAVYFIKNINCFREKLYSLVNPTLPGNILKNTNEKASKKASVSLWLYSEKILFG